MSFNPHTLYILIENPGVAPSESFTLLGASNKDGHSRSIGKFGSGTKLGTLSLLRAKLDPIVYCGNLRLQFGTKPVVFDGENHEQVVVKVSGKTPAGKSVNRTEDLSVTLGYGKSTWTKPVLAVREFISNALDSVDGDASKVNVSLVNVEDIRARAGYTRVYVPCTPETDQIVVHLSTWFLHFKDGANVISEQVITKDKPSPAAIYRRGVLVRYIQNAEPSLFDYNLNNLTLDEARLADDWSVRSEAAKAIRDLATPEQLAKVLGSGLKCWEHELDLVGRWETPTEQVAAARTKRWEKAQTLAVADNTVILDETSDASLAEGKGYRVARVAKNVADAAAHYGLRTKDKILTADEREGRRVDDVTRPEAIRVCQDVWDTLNLIQGSTRGEAFPKIKTFTQDLIGGAITKGVYKDGTVYINSCLLAGDEISNELFATILEEFAHHITKATDNSRDFQEYFIQLVTRLLHQR